MGKMSKEKGKRGERDVAKILCENGIEARRGVQYKGGTDSPDVIGMKGVHIEVKYTESFRLWDAMEQSQKDSGEGEIPVVIHKKNRKPWVVVLGLEDFIKLYKGGGE